MILAFMPRQDLQMKLLAGRPQKDVWEFKVDSFAANPSGPSSHVLCNRMASASQWGSEIKFPKLLPALWSQEDGVRSI